MCHYCVDVHIVMLHDRIGTGQLARHISDPSLGIKFIHRRSVAWLSLM